MLVRGFGLGIRIWWQCNDLFWRTSNGAELDLLLVRGDQRIEIEVKRADAPRVTPSMRAAIADLELSRLDVYYPGNRRYILGDGSKTFRLLNLQVPSCVDCGYNWRIMSLPARRHTQISTSIRTGQHRQQLRRGVPIADGDQLINREF